MATHTVGGMINGAFALIRINDETSIAEWSTNGSVWTPIAAGGSGDMEKSVYDTNDDGVVNNADYAETAGSAETASHATTAGSAETANAIGSASSTDVETAVENSHTHSNKTTLDKFGEQDGMATFDGEPISSASETPENRLLPDPESLPENLLGGPVVFTAANTTDETYILRFPFLDDLNDYSHDHITIFKVGTVALAGDTPYDIGRASSRFEPNSCLYGYLLDSFGTGDFTINLWLKTDSLGTQTIFSTREGNSTSSSTFALMISNNNNLYVYADGDKTPGSTVTQWTANVWHHIRLVRASGALTIMLDGSVTATGTMANNLTNLLFSIGGSYGDGRVYESTNGCYMASLEVLNYAMSTDEFYPEYVPGILTGRGYDVLSHNEMRQTLGLLDYDFKKPGITTAGKLILSVSNGLCQGYVVSSTTTLEGNLDIVLPSMSLEHPEMEIVFRIERSCTLSINSKVFFTADEPSGTDLYVMRLRYLEGGPAFTFEKLWVL